MKFGQELHRHTIPEWHEHYIDYNLLKRLVKSLPACEGEPRTPGRVSQVLLQMG